jgi:hypothetical protein
MTGEPDVEGEQDLPVHEAIARLEARIEALADDLERCRKIALFSKLLLTGGALWLAAGLLGIVYLGPAALGAIAAILGGIVLSGSNRSTVQQVEAALNTAERQRAALIGAIDLRPVDGRVEAPSEPVRWLH